MTASRAPSREGGGGGGGGGQEGSCGDARAVVRVGDHGVALAPCSCNKAPCSSAYEVGDVGGVSATAVPHGLPEAQMGHGVVQGGSRPRRSGGAVTFAAPGEGWRAQVGASITPLKIWGIISKIGFFGDNRDHSSGDRNSAGTSRGLAAAPVRRRAFEDNTVR